MHLLGTAFGLGRQSRHAEATYLNVAPPTKNDGKLPPTRLNVGKTCPSMASGRSASTIEDGYFVKIAQ
jgi:hypothetical protein